MSEGEARKAATLAEVGRRREARRVQVWYVVLMGFLGMVLGLTLAFSLIFIQGKDQREATCAVVIANRDVYRETPPSTETGRKAQEAWEGLARTLGC